MKYRFAAALVCVLFLPFTAFAQQPAVPATAAPVAPAAAPAPAPAAVAAKLTNADIIDMTGLGLSDDVIIDKIYASPDTAFDTGLPALHTLKAAKVSDAVIRAMINPQAPGNNTAPPPPPAGASTANEAIAAAAAAQAAPPPPAAPAAPAAPVEPFHSTDGYVRMYVTDHPIDETIGMMQASANRHYAAADSSTKHEAGDDPRTVEIQADVQKDCSAYIRVTNNPDHADYILVFRRQGGKRSTFFAMGGLTGLAISAASKVDGASLFENTGDMVYATKQTSVEKSIQDICVHIPPPGAPAPQVAAAPVPAPPTPPAPVPPAK